ncbi:hypothetical protein HYDPIDRAFT_24874 [Hydnomerulius pinastri MD-312]|nr:hypothetical protein HYDPIDRAFT_24874 [Hydnomerulius pinastri MD-312]
MASADHLITFFDLDGSSSKRPFSPMTWNTRFVLNYKQLPYRTEWVPFGDVAKILKENNVPPTMQRKPFYTVPAITDNRNVASGGELKILSDSTPIADYLEETYPDRPIYAPGKDIVHAYLREVRKLRMAVESMCVAHTSAILDGRHKEAFISSRTEHFGMHPDELFSPEKQGDVWVSVYGGLKVLSDYIDGLGKANSEAAFPFGVDKPCYADFAVCAALLWFQKTSPEGAWEKIKDLNGGKWGRLFEGCEPYMQEV